LHKAGEDVPPEINLDQYDLVDWMEGIEHLQKVSVEGLYDMLGFSDRKIPFLAATIDVEPEFAVLPGDEDIEGATTPMQVTMTQPLTLKWHQLVGVVKMVECALTSQPVMLMDNVGLGKTLEVVAFFAVMAYYRKFYSETKRYPGVWGAYLIRCDGRTLI
jgi:hypothetical protein